MEYEELGRDSCGFWAKIGKKVKVRGKIMANNSIAHSKVPSLRHYFISSKIVNLIIINLRSRLHLKNIPLTFAIIMIKMNLHHRFHLNLPQVSTVEICS